MARVYFKAFHSYLKAMEPLNDAERGRLFTACLEYSMTGAPPDLRGNERFIFPMIQASIDADEESYRNTAKINAENGAKGGRPPKAYKTETNRKNPSGFCETEKSQEEDTEDTEGTEDRRKEDTPKPPRGFDEFWAAYPRKIGKDAARKAFEKRKPDDALLSEMLAAVEQQKKSASWKKDGGQFIPHPATWLNQGRWMDEVAAPDDYYKKL